jgi:hypothetical protein
MKYGSKTLRYGPEPYDIIEVKAIVADEEGLPLGYVSFIKVRDEDSGTEWNLDPKQATELAEALLAAARDVWAARR